jgi:hypothetical protein
VSKYLKVYELLCPDDNIRQDDPRRNDIIGEMKNIHKAKTIEEAAEVILWWDSWPNPRHQTATEFVAEARNLMNEND